VHELDCITSKHNTFYITYVLGKGKLSGPKRDEVGNESECRWTNVIDIGYLDM
jgi:hypothetical protein